MALIFALRRGTPTILDPALHFVPHIARRAVQEIEYCSHSSLPRKPPGRHENQEQGDRLDEVIERVMGQARLAVSVCWIAAAANDRMRPAIPASTSLRGHLNR